MAGNSERPIKTHDPNTGNHPKATSGTRPDFRGNFHFGETGIRLHARAPRAEGNGRGGTETGVRPDETLLGRGAKGWSPLTDQNPVPDSIVPDAKQVQQP